MGAMVKRCKTEGCKAELTDPTKGYCSIHIHNIRQLNETVFNLLRRYNYETMENANETDA